MTQLELFPAVKPARADAYVCPRCAGVSYLGVEFCSVHGWFPAWRRKP